MSAEPVGTVFSTEPHSQAQQEHPCRTFAAMAQEPAHRLSVTPAMLAAGRAAFKRRRRLIDDLWQAFDCDIDVAVRDIYRSMARAAE